MSEAELILPTMRGGCVRVGNKVHTLFRVISSAPRSTMSDDARSLRRSGAEPSEMRERQPG